MKTKRRKDIDRAIALLEAAKSIIETAGGEEREVYDNMPESLQVCEKGNAADEAATALEEAADAIDEIIGNLETAKGE
jgi:hypothetical protein